MAMNRDRSPRRRDSDRTRPVPRWEVRVSGADVRTMTLEELVDAWRTGLLDGAVSCRRAGSRAWCSLRDIDAVRARMDRGPAVPASLGAPAGLTSGRHAHADGLDGGASRRPAAPLAVPSSAPVRDRSGGGSVPPSSGPRAAALAPVTLVSPSLSVAAAVPLGFLAGALAAVAVLFAVPGGRDRRAVWGDSMASAGPRRGPVARELPDPEAPASARVGAGPFVGAPAASAVPGPADAGRTDLAASSGGGSGPDHPPPPGR